MSRNRTPDASGPSGDSHTAASASASAPGSAATSSTGQRTSCSVTCASSSPRRSGACGSACSSTACTSEPNVAPTGSAAIGEGTSTPANAKPGSVSPSTGTAASGSSSRGTDSGSLPTPPVGAPTSKPSASRGVLSAVYEVRRQSWSMRRVNAPIASAGARGGSRTGVNAAGTASSRVSAPAVCQRASHCPTSFSGRSGALSGTTGSSARRPSSIRCSGEAGVLRSAPAHHSTTWLCARVSATYSSRSDSPQSSARCRATASDQNGPPGPPTSRHRSRPGGASWKRAIGGSFVPVNRSHSVGR